MAAVLAVALIVAGCGGPTGPNTSSANRPPEGLPLPVSAVPFGETDGQWKQWIVPESAFADVLKFYTDALPLRADFGPWVWCDFWREFDNLGRIYAQQGRGLMYVVVFDGSASLDIADPIVGMRIDEGKVC